MIKTKKSNLITFTMLLALCIAGSTVRAAFEKVTYPFRSITMEGSESHKQEKKQQEKKATKKVHHESKWTITVVDANGKKFSHDYNDEKSCFTAYNHLNNKNAEHRDVNNKKTARELAVEFLRTTETSLSQEDQKKLIQQLEAPLPSLPPLPELTDL